jgi:CheY-like chemotaxis protein
VLATFCVLGLALIASVFDARLEANARILAMSQATAAERQQLLERERIARDQAERLSALKDEFLATLSHELRTPLNAMLGWAGMLQRGVKDEATFKRGLETIERNARAQGQLIDDLLDMSRIIAGTVRLDVQTVDPARIVEAAVGTVHPAAAAKTITLRTDLGRDGGDAVIRVIDSGIGIAPDFLPYVFDRFRQQDASISRQHGGLGLGLSIAKQLVELHGGTIAVDSAGPHTGTTFTVRLPLARREAVVPAPGQRAAAQAGALADLSGLRVLVIDDAPDTLDVLEQILTVSGAATLTAPGAGAALALLEKEKPDVIVSDVGMPEVDGFELMRRIRRRAATAQIPAIALTAFTRQDDRTKALQAGFTDYLAKPVEPAALAAAIRRAVARGGEEKTARDV